jgi:predicted dehydrogenase
MSRITRRSFLQGAAMAGGAAMAFPVPYVSANALGANDRILVAVVGINGRGHSHIEAFAKMKGVQVACLVDPDKRLFPLRSKQVKEMGGNDPKCVQDLREALKDKDLDVVSIATCNHWHSLATIWACQAGKDVYVEKPASHNVFEGRRCVDAARKFNRIVQHGTQSRSDGRWARSVAAAQSGTFGKLLVSKGYASKVRWTIGFKKPAEPPKDFNFDLWLGPASKQRYHQNIVHYNWHWFWDFGNGEIGNQGVHQMDIARWVMPPGSAPKSVISMGCRYVDEPEGFRDQGETPNMQLAVIDFGGPLLVFEVRGLTGRDDRSGKKIPSQVDNEFYLEEGVIRGGKFYPKGKTEGKELPKVEIKIAPGDHFANFIKAVRSRRTEALNADIVEGHLSSACCHLPNISYRLGQQVPFGQRYDALGDCPQIRDSIKAIEENLVRALGMDLSKFTYQLGAKLEYDAQAEQFVDNPKASAMLTRPYRKPFVVPEKV